MLIATGMCRRNDDVAPFSTETESNSIGNDMGPGWFHFDSMTKYSCRSIWACRRKHSLISLRSNMEEPNHMGRVVGSIWTGWSAGVEMCAGAIGLENWRHRCCKCPVKWSLEMNGRTCSNTACNYTQLLHSKVLLRAF